MGSLRSRMIPSAFVGYILLRLLFVLGVVVVVVDVVTPVVVVVAYDSNSSPLLQSRRRVLGNTVFVGSSTFLPLPDDDFSTTFVSRAATIISAKEEDTTTITTQQQQQQPKIELPIQTLSGKSYRVEVPQVGYSLYKTPAEQAELCVSLALQAGIQHIDVATQYGTNTEVGHVLKSYVNKGSSALITTEGGGGGGATSPPPLSTKKERRQQLFISHKLSNEEQSEDKGVVKKAVKKQLKILGLDQLDLCSIHSPLTNSNKRLATYSALLELQNEGLVRAVGVCNYGVNPLQEILDAGLPAPSVNQLVLSPFNQHTDVVDWANRHRTILSCNAWSRLSSTDGPQEGWAKLADIGKARGLTKAQVLVCWALQKGYLSVPRSGSKFKIERTAIQENSFNGVRGTILTEKEMSILDGLDEKITAGRLGIVDGWSTADILSEEWDPTLAV